MDILGRQRIANLKQQLVETRAASRRDLSVAEERITDLRRGMTGLELRNAELEQQVKSLKQLLKDAKEQLQWGTDPQLLKENRHLRNWISRLPQMTLQKIIDGGIDFPPPNDDGRAG